MKTKTCGITGHREIINADHVWDVIGFEVMAALLEGYTYFISGMANGADMEFAGLIAKVKEYIPFITLEAAIPYRDRLNANNPRLQELLGKCDKITVTSEEYSRNCYLIRNSYLVKNSDKLIAVFDGRKRGGTVQTINIARKKKCEIRLVMI